MKLFLIAVVASVISVQILVDAFTKDERLAARNKCKEESGVKEEILNHALNGNFIEDEDLKKHTKCFFEELGVMKGNDIDKEKLENFVEVALPDKKDQAKQIAEECSEKKKDDPKETAYEVGKCVLEKKQQ